MLRNYLNLTIRNLKSNKGYFIINLLGLTIGITLFIFIVLWIKAETSYDKFHKNANNIYRVDYLLYEEGILEQHSASGSTGVGKEIKNMFPEVEGYTRFYRTESLVKYGDKTFKERNILYAQSSFFNLFSFPLVEGKPDSNLLAINHAVITEETARKYFGDENPIGKMITLDGASDFEVTGIVKSIPANSHFKFDILVSYENLIKSSRYWDNSWVSERVYTYILLTPGADAEALQAKLPQIPETFIGKFMKEAFFLLEYRLVKLTDIHLHSSVSNELEVNGSYRGVVSLGIIACLVLLIAFINYINLATSRSIERAHEVGIRKVTGALKKDLVFQFLTESALLNLIALIVSLTGVFLLLPFFKQVMQSPLQIDYLIVILLFILLLVSGSLFTGLLPAIYISRFAPGLVLKGKNPTGSVWISRLKNYLVVFQFTISVILIIGTITIYRQVNFMRNHDLGFDIEGLLVLDGPRILRANTYESYMNSLESFKNEIVAQSVVSSITGSSSVPGTEIKNSRVFGIPVEGRNTEKKIELYYVDDHFFDTYGLTLLAGNNFEATIKEETNKIILNESALPYFGFEDPESTIGKILRGGNQEVTIKGIVNDFNQQSLKELPRPIAFFNQPANIFYTIKTNMTGIDQLLPELEKIWNTHYPGNPFNYFFLDDFYDEQYRADQRFSGLFLASSILAIIIACLGLSGLSAYSISRRTKEIGIRRTNGARIAQVMVLLNKDFVKWVVIAIVIASPVAWFVMDKWLQNFAYRIGISWWIFVLSGAIAVAIALITVSWQSWKAAVKNPVETLRYE
ncbi:MAG: ABC transporter permease [Bacteroidales bacterium]|nr:ABC transporter permease [Bacteroidales bacterium]